jgi:hypothetical protein
MNINSHYASDLSLPPKLFQAIGTVVYQYQRLENSVAANLSAFINIENIGVGRVITSVLSMRQMMDMIDPLMRLRLEDPRAIEYFSNLLKECVELESKRNAIVHADWKFMRMRSSDNNFVVKPTRQKKKLRRGQSLKIDIDVLDDEATKIYEAANHINNLFDRLVNVFWNLRSFKQRPGIPIGDPPISWKLKPLRHIDLPPMYKVISGNEYLID